MAKGGDGPREQGRVLWKGLPGRREPSAGGQDDLEPSPRRKTFWRPLMICLAGFVLAFWAQYTFHLWAWDIPFEIAKEAAIAFLVAAILYVALEYNAERIAHEETVRFRDLVSRDVFQALMGRIIPDAVFHEINDVLHSDVVRNDCEYVITFAKPYPEMPPGYFIIRREGMYTVTNLLVSRSTTYSVRSYHSNDLGLNSTAWRDRNFHLRLLVNGEEIPLREGENLFVQDDTTFFEHAVRLGPGGSARISLRGEEPSLVSAGRNTYLQGTPGIGLRVEVRNEYPEVIGESEVHLNHPGRSEVKRDDFGRYVLSRALLPGQGFQVLWKKIEPEP